MTAGIDVPLLAQTVALPPPGLTLAAFIKALNGQSVGGCGGFPTGQCTALACAWCRNLGLGTPCGACGAPDKCDGVCWSGSGFPGFTWTPYSAGKVPAPGDLVSYHPCSGQDIGASGHVGVFVSGNATSFTGFDQNWNGAYCRLITHSYACVQGWQHPLTSVVIGPPPPSPPPPSVVTVGNGLLVGALALGLGAIYLRRNHPELHARITGRPSGFTETQRQPDGTLLASVAPSALTGAGFSRTRTMSLTPAAALVAALPVADYSSAAGFLLPDGTLLDTMGEEHADIAWRVAKVTLPTLLRSGVARWRYDYDLYLEIHTPLTSMQQRTVRDFLNASQHDGRSVNLYVDAYQFTDRDGYSHGYAGWAPGRLAVGRVFREANAFVEETHGHARTRTPMSPSAEAVATFALADPDANAPIYGFLLPDGRVVDIGDQQHFRASRQMGEELGHLQEQGFMRFVMSAHPHQRQVYVEATVPFTAAQVRTLREIEDHWRVQVHIDATLYPSGQYTSADAHVLTSGYAQDAVGLRRLIAETNAALEGGHARSKSLEARAIAAFGTTDELRDASFVLPDGTMLAWPSGTGERTRESPSHHPDLAEFLTGKPYLDPLLSAGWMRVQNFRAILVTTVGQPLTPEQAARIRAGADPFDKLVIEADLGSAMWDRPHCEASPPTPTAINACVRTLNEDIERARTAHDALLERMARDHPGLLR